MYPACLRSPVTAGLDGIRLSKGRMIDAQSTWLASSFPRQSQGKYLPSLTLRRKQAGYDSGTCREKRWYFSNSIFNQEMDRALD